MFERLRQKYGFNADVDDSTVLRHVRNLKFPDGVDDDTFADGVADFENEGAGASNPPRATPRPGVAPASLTTMGEVYSAVPKALYGAGKALVQDAANYPRARIADPLLQAGRAIGGIFESDPAKRAANAMPNEEEVSRARNARAFETGTALGGPAQGLATKAFSRVPGAVLRRILANAGAGAAVGGTDAGIRENSLRAVPAGAGAGAILGGTIGEVAHRFAPARPVADTGKVPFDVPEPDPTWHAGTEIDQPTYAKVGGGMLPKHKAQMTRGEGEALEGMYGGALDEPSVPAPRTMPLKGAMAELEAKIKALESDDLKIELMPTEDALHIVSIEGSNPIKSGRAMIRAAKLADEYGVPLSGEDRPLAGGQVSELNLRSLYEKVGGKPVSEGSPFMRREPKGGSGGFARAYPEEFEAVVRGELEPGEAILKATGPGVDISEGELAIMASRLAKEAESARPRQIIQTPSTKLSWKEQRALQGLYGAPPPRRPRNLREIMDQPQGEPKGFAEKLARSPLGPLVSSVTDRTRALGPAGREIDDMIEAVVRQSQETPGLTLQPFDEAVHKVAGKKGRLSEDARSQLRGALQGRVDPKTLSPELAPLYTQMKGYFGETIGRGSKLGAMVSRGEKKIPLKEVAIEHYMPQRAATVRDIKGDKDLRASMERNLEDLGVASSPEEAAAILDDHIAFVESKGKTGGQLAIRATARLNPDKSPAELRHWLLSSKPPLRDPASGLEYSRTVNSPFYDPRPEVIFPKHVVENERALAEIEHFGQDASKLTGKVGELPSELQNEARHLIRTATESHAPWDPRLESFLANLRKAQLSLFTPITSTKNISQRANTGLTSDAGEALRHGIIPTPSAVKIGARSGALAEGGHETLAQALGDKPGAMARWLKWIGFTGVERGNRQTAGKTGLEEAKKYARRLAANPNDKTAAYRLSREGLPTTGEPLTDLLENRAALARSNRAQFRTHPKDLPDWFTSNPATRTAALFKSFDYQQTRLILTETIGRLTSGQPGDKARGVRNLVILGTVYPAIGEGINDIYGIAFRRETPAQVVKRSREWIDDTAKVGTGRMDPAAYAKKYQERYWKDMLAGSAPGAGGGFVTALSYGEGDKGGALLKGAAGPAISRPYEATQLLYDVLKRQGKVNKRTKKKLDEMTPGQKRQALRLLLGGPGSLAGPWLAPSKPQEKD